MSYDRTLDTLPGTTWSGSHRYTAAAVHHPRSVEEVSELVRSRASLRTIGTGHTFNELADGPVQVALDRMPPTPVLDAAAGTVDVPAAMRYGELAVWLHERGWALHNLASLPHISVAGAVATGTHGAGDRLGSLATAVAGLELVDGRGELVTVRRSDPDFAGLVVGLGAMGIVTRVLLDVEPTYEVGQTVYHDVPWTGFDYAAATAAGDSVSLFTSWTTAVIPSIWVKRRSLDAFPDILLGGWRQTADTHPTRTQSAANTTPQCGVRGVWYERWPHFRLGFTPSTGAELQTEYLLPRTAAADAFDALRALAAGPLGHRFAELLIISEVRSVAADDLWLSGAYGRPTVGIHLTWRLDVPGVTALLPALDAALVPLGGRPHWGKLHDLTADRIAPLYPRFADVLALRDRYDPERRFSSRYVAGLLGE